MKAHFGKFLRIRDETLGTDRVLLDHGRRASLGSLSSTLKPNESPVGIGLAWVALAASGRLALCTVVHVRGVPPR